jgi:hypothetical protein
VCDFFTLLDGAIEFRSATAAHGDLLVSCNAVLADTDGSKWEIAEPYACSNETYPVKKSKG